MRIRLYIFLYFTASMLLDVAYRTMDRLARGRASDWQVVLLEQATGYYVIHSNLIIFAPDTCSWYDC